MYLNIQFKIENSDNIYIKFIFQNTFERSFHTKPILCDTCNIIYSEPIICDTTATSFKIPVITNFVGHYHRSFLIQNNNVDRIKSAISEVSFDINTNYNQLFHSISKCIRLYNNKNDDPTTNTNIGISELHGP